MHRDLGDGLFQARRALDANLTFAKLEIGDIDRRIAAGESLARDRFDSDCVLGTQFESSQPFQ